jgi:hypothetical protein
MDASDFAFSGVLQQPDEHGDLHLVAFYSQKFSPAKTNYDVHDKELLGIVNSFCNMRAWLLGSPFPISIISDHKNLEYFMSSQILNCHQVHWVMFLSDFDFKLTWGPGKLNVADGPSCRLDFVPKKGDDTLLGQNRIILTSKHTECLSPNQTSSDSSPTIPNPSINAIMTLAIDNLVLLECFKTTFQEDPEW